RILLAHIKMIGGDKAAGEAMLTQADAIQQLWGSSDDLNTVQAYRARLALWQGDVAAARRWQQETQLTVSTQLNHATEFQLLVLARLLITEGRLKPSTPCLGDALALLGRIEKTAVSTKRFGRVMEAHLLQALAHDALGNHDEAVLLLQQALSLAEAEGFVRTFVNEGEPMAVLLGRLDKQLASTPSRSPFITKLLAAFPDKTTPPQSPQSPIPNPQSPLIEPLSERETEILALIAAGLKNKEIAAQLFISLNTIHYHTKNLYG
ncbi:MAG: hypothetical protein GY927_11605, partial [bacterium]|nr:hypothetical protein [bacterium]